MKKKFNWLGFAALIVWDIGAMQSALALMQVSNAFFSMSSQTRGIQSYFNVYFIILFVLAILVNLVICKHNIWMIIIGAGDLIWLIWCGIDYKTYIPVLSIIGCVLVIAAGIYGLVTAKKSDTNSQTESDK